MNRKTSIAPNALQQVLDSAANASHKGQAQWHTPDEWAKVLALALSDHRPNIIDLTCGNGQMLRAVKQRHSLLFGVEIEPFATAEDDDVQRITADVTKLWPLFRGVGFCGDCFVLNFPWDCHWYRDRLRFLADADDLAVQAAFAAHDGRTSRDTIDSTVAGFCLALALGTYQSEGFLIANNATLERLITRTTAPHHALAQHVWAHLIVDGNICSPKAVGQSGTDFQTGILYFANAHTAGVQANRRVQNLEEARRALLAWKANRIELRKGAELNAWNLHLNTGLSAKWRAMAEEWTRLQDVTQSQYNIWLAADGTIRTALSLYDEHSGRYKHEAAKLHELNGKRPLQLVMQMQQRKALLAATSATSPWRVAPDLTAAVQQAVTAYGSQRAPLVALNPIQRLAYLDEIDVIECVADLGVANPISASGGRVLPQFCAGGRYAIRTTTVMVKRKGRKVNMAGLYDDVQWDGQELAIYIKDELGVECLFMEERLRHESVKVSVVAPGQIAAFKRMGISEVVNPCAIDFSLQELVVHFKIPDVPDVAALNPQGYQRNVNLLKEMEQLVNA